MLGVGGRNVKHVGNLQSALKARANHLELVFFLSRQKDGPILVTTGSCCLSSWDFHWSFLNGSFLEGPHYDFGFHLDLSGPPT